MSPKSTTETDVEIGRRITVFRKAKGLSQTALGQVIGVTFQQVQKYEKGQNRVGGGRLIAIAEALDCSASDLMGEGAGTQPLAPFSAETLALAAEIEALPATLPRAAVRSAIRALAQAVAA